MNGCIEFVVRRKRGQRWRNAVIGPCGRPVAGDSAFCAFHQKAHPEEKPRLDVVEQIERRHGAS
jgi:hypothetical protein